MFYSQRFTPSGGFTAALFTFSLIHSGHAQPPTYGAHAPPPAYGGHAPLPAPVNSPQLTGFTPCDALLAANLSHAVHMPTSPYYSYLVQNGSYALDTRKEPWCFVQPQSASELSATINALRGAGHGAGDWHIAVRSGGHGRDDSNNVASGVTIDLTHLNATTYNDLTKVASVGTGARWGHVYTELEKSGVVVTGGREAVVGVGGLVLGGGISWYSARTGFACDNVVNFEVVLASGDIVNANASSHKDLYKALKGGSSNFGIVTRFDLETVPAQNLNIQSRIISRDRADDVIDALTGFTDLDKSHSDNAMISILTYNPETEQSTFAVTEVNTMDKANSTAFDAMNRIPTLIPPTTVSEPLSKSANKTQLSGNHINAGSGALVIVNDPRTMRYCMEQYDALVASMKTLLGPKGFAPILDFQPFPAYFAEYGVQKGGNMLGLEHDPRNKIVFITAVTLLNDKDAHLKPRVYQEVVALNKRVEAYAKSIDSYTSFSYLPYADARQNPLGNYGKANVQHIRQVAKKYDPRGFFQKRVPGGFKIDRV